MSFWRTLDLAYALVSGDHERLIAGDRHFYVADVQICGEVPDGRGTFYIQDLRDQTAILAERVPHLGKPVVVKMQFTPIFTKTASHLHGRRVINPLLVTATVYTADGQTEMGRTAVLLHRADNADEPRHGEDPPILVPQEVQRTLDVEAASNLLEQIYGTKDWDRFMHPELQPY